jgi:hypothetical protein
VQRERRLVDRLLEIRVALIEQKEDLDRRRTAPLERAAEPLISRNRNRSGNAKYSWRWR